MSPIKSARFVQPYGGHWVVIEMHIDHAGVYSSLDRYAVVTCLANTQTQQVRDVSGVREDSYGGALIEYIKEAAAAPGGRLRAAIDYAAAKGW